MAAIGLKPGGVIRTFFRPDGDPDRLLLESVLMAGRSEFLGRFEKVVRASGWRTTPSPAELVSYWRDFVETCEEGYSSTIYDYENERAVRDLLDQAFHDPILRKFAEIDDLRASVEEIDDRFRRACRDDVVIGDADVPWWRRCVPRRAEGEFAADLRSKFDIDST